MSLDRWLLLAALLAWGEARAQGLPVEGEQRRVEVEVVASDAGVGLSAEDALRLGLATDGGTAALEPPTVITDSPAAWPDGAAGASAEVTLELLLDEQGQVAEARVAQAPEDPRFSAAALLASKGLRFSPATVGGKPVSVRLPFVYLFVSKREEQPPVARLEGEVRQRGNRRPVPEAALFLDDAESPLATADLDGRFKVEVPPGTHRLQVRGPGCLPGSFVETLQGGETLQVVYRLVPSAIDPYETVVRADRPRTELARVTLKAQEIREVPGTQGDPFRVVMLLPGVGSLASGVSYPVVRGSQPAATGFFLDGVRIPMLYHLVLGPAVVHPDFVEGIDFYPPRAWYALCGTTKPARSMRAARWTSRSWGSSSRSSSSTFRTRG